ncbi:MAG: DNA polymerase III subunit gamma/tau [bacterium]
MSDTLYRKYRPQTFAEYKEQDHVKTTLQHQILRGSVAHAYVFSGPRGVGKTSLARIFAKTLNCQNRKEVSAEPCNTCQNCLEIKESRSLDVVEIDAASHTSVENVRERIIESCRFQPLVGKYKIFIIDEAHMLSAAAFNALLKTLEEPPAHVVFILASTELHKFPETVLSRCQRFLLRKIKLEQLVQKLEEIAVKEGVSVDQEVLLAISRRADGGFRDAESVLEQVLATGEKQITLESVSMLLPSIASKSILGFVGFLSKEDASSALKQIANLIEEGSDLSAFADEVVAALRLMLIAKVTGDKDLLKQYYDPNVAGELEKVSSLWSESQLVKVLERLVLAAREAKYDDFPSLPLEIAVVEIASGPSAAEPRTTPKIASPKALERPVAQAPEIQTTPGSSSAETPRAVSESKAPTSVSKGLDELQILWPDVIMKISEVSQSLPFILKLANISAVNGGELVLNFQYPFHADTLNRETNRLIVEKAWKDVAGIACTVSGVALGKVEPVVMTPATPGDAKLKAILDEFGGKVVNAI